MHRAAYRALGLPHTFDAHAVDEAGVRAMVDALREGRLDGINVTVPHKRLALSLADAYDETARVCGAANTLVRDRAGGVVAYNTDVPALAYELRELGASLDGRSVLVVGAGGAARAAILAASRLGATAVVVRARNAAKAEELRMLVPGVRIEPLTAAPRDDGSFAAIVQATSAGMQGGAPGEAVAEAVAWDTVDPAAVAYDVVYAPAVTPFIEAARRRGLRAESGLGMLARQGALAFEHWLAIPAPLEVMRAAITAP